jgi:hypothetical protein
MADPLRAYPAHDDHPDAGLASSGESMERRIRRLEDAVAAMQDTQLMEDRVVERVVERVELFPPPHSGPGLIAGAARLLMPKMIDAAPDANPTGSAATITAAARSTWFGAEVFGEVRWMLRMLTDYRFRMSWTGRTVLVGAIVVGFLSWFAISGLPLVGGILDRTVLVLAAIVTYKAMGRELHRYRELMARVYFRR